MATFGFVELADDCQNRAH